MFQLIKCNCNLCVFVTQAQTFKGKAETLGSLHGRLGGCYLAVLINNILTAHIADGFAAIFASDGAGVAPLFGEGAVGVYDEVEGKVVGFAEFSVAVYGVGADAENDGVFGFDLGVGVAEFAGLEFAAAGEVSRVEVEDHELLSWL